MEVIISYVLKLLAAAVVAVAGVFVKRYLGDAAAARVMELVKTGVGYAKKAAKRKLGNVAKGVDFDNEVVDQAFKFVMERAPKWLKRAGITEGFLRELIEGELENNKTDSEK